MRGDAAGAIIAGVGIVDNGNADAMRGVLVEGDGVDDDVDGVTDNNRSKWSDGASIDGADGSVGDGAINNDGEEGVSVNGLAAFISIAFGNGGIIALNGCDVTNSLSHAPDVVRCAINRQTASLSHTVGDRRRSIGEPFNDVTAVLR
jgi:hypothetical protein